MAQSLEPHKIIPGLSIPHSLLNTYFSITFQRCWFQWLSHFLIPDTKFKCFTEGARCDKTIKVLGLLLTRWSVLTQFSLSPSATVWVMEAIWLFLLLMNRKRKLGLEVKNIHYNFPFSDFSLGWNKISFIKHKWKMCASSGILTCNK